MGTHLILSKRISCSNHPSMADFMWKI